MRDHLGIPRTATVFGRYGGLHTFNVEVARRAVAEVEEAAAQAIAATKAERERAVARAEAARQVYRSAGAIP